MISKLSRAKLRIKTEFRDFILYFLLPLPALILPWSWCFRVYRRLCNTRLNFGIDPTAIEKNLKRLNYTGDIKAAIIEQQLIRFVDIVDGWLGFFYNTRLESKLVKLKGKWSDEPDLLLGTHIGPGTLSLSSMCLHGLKPNLIIRPIPDEMRKTHTILWLYYKVRIAFHYKTLGDGTVFSGRGIKPVLTLMEEKKAIIMLTDVAAKTPEKSIQIEINERQMRVHSSIFNLVAEKKLRLCTFIITLDMETGKRIFRVGDTLTCDTTEELHSYVAGEFKQAMEKHLPQWQLMPQLDAYLIKNN